MAVNARNGIALSGLSAVNGVTDISAINGISASIGGGGSSLLTNLVAYYDMAGTDGLIDIHGSKDMTEGGTIGSASGPVSGESARGKATTTTTDVFTGTDDVDFEPGSSAFSISCWVWANSTAQSGLPSIFCKRGDSTNFEWEIGLDGSNTRFRFRASNNGTGFTAVNGTSASDDTWYHLGCCWDGTDLKMSINGAAFITTAFAGPVNTGSEPYRILGRSGTGASLSGNVGPTAFWKGRALSLAEFQSIYNSGSGLPYSSW